MKKYLLLLLTLAFLPGCNKDDNTNNNNPYLPRYNFSITIDTQLPLYAQLQFTSNPVFINQAGIGINGVIVMNTGNNNFAAFEATCPNQELSQCSQLTIDGINAICPCDNVAYNLFSGDGGQKYRLLQYRVEVISPTLIRIYN